MSTIAWGESPIPKVLSTNGKVVLALKESILSGGYPIGSLLPPEDELIRQLEVSRVSLREGIKQLEALGWLRIERGNGTRVTQPGFSVMENTIDFLARFEILRFEHLHQLRRVIEIETVQDLARSPPSGLVARLREANSLIVANHTTPAGYVDADVAFHDLLLEHSPNPLFSRLMAGFRKYLLLSRRLSFAGAAAVLETAAAHEAIIACIERRDVEASRRAMEDHLRITQDQIKTGEGADA
jgi:GntR family transcriptional repressor for pyruvate dehydrogenase complex